MAPDRGSQDGSETARISSSNSASPRHGPNSEARPVTAREQQERLLAERAASPQNFTVRSVVLGLAIGVVIIFSNTYFGLQTGWISGMAMPSALLGFAAFRAWEAAFPADEAAYKDASSATSRMRRAFRLRVPFSPVENVLVQTVAGSAGTMPLGCGFVGVIVALEYLLDADKDGQGPMNIALWKLIVWAVGICLFGVVFGVPLRRQVIIREKLKFPTGTATALMISVLHGDKEEAQIVKQGTDDAGNETEPETEHGEEGAGLLARQTTNTQQSPLFSDIDGNADAGGDWQGKIRLMGLAFAGSAIYTMASYFVPQVHDLPILGGYLANTWLWTLNPSPAYVGQGIIMGPVTTAHMLLGAILGWGILSPLAKQKGWATGPVSDWATGSKGWIVWVSLAIMLADSIVSLGWLILRPSVFYLRLYGPTAFEHARKGQWKELGRALNRPPRGQDRTGYAPVRSSSLDNPGEADDDNDLTKLSPASDEPEIDAPPEHLIHTRELSLWLVLSLILYFASIHIAFPAIIPFGLDVLALLLATLLSVMGVRALGSTDLNPVSGISKLTQLVFAAIVPAANAQAVTINLLAGAVSESGALQAGDLLQDLKTGHLLGAAPNAQFYGQLIGSVVGAVVSAVVYKLYTSVYTIPSGQFQVPTGYVWLFTAELVTGKGLPPLAAEFALAFAAIFAVLTAIRTYLQSPSAKRYGDMILPFVPSGIAVAVGMYNTPSFTLARTAGGLLSWWWVRIRGGSEAGVVILASGLILGEGLFSIVNLAFASLELPHT